MCVRLSARNLEKQVDALASNAEGLCPYLFPSKIPILIDLVIAENLDNFGKFKDKKFLRIAKHLEHSQA